MAEKLFNRNFVLLWQGQLVGNIGSQAFLVAAVFWTMPEQRPTAESLRSSAIPIRSIDPTDASKQRNFGDYITLPSDDNSLVAIWTDGRDGRARIYSRTLEIK